MEIKCAYSPPALYVYLTLLIFYLDKLFWYWIQWGLHTLDWSFKLTFNDYMRNRKTATKWMQYILIGDGQ